MNAAGAYLDDAAASAAALAGGLDSAQQQIAAVNGRPATPRYKDKQ